MRMAVSGSWIGISGAPCGVCAVGFSWAVALPGRRASGLLFGGEALDQVGQRVEAAVPEGDVAGDPFGGFHQRLALEVAAPPLGIALAHDEPGALPGR